MIGVQECWVLVFPLFLLPLLNELMATVLDIYLVCQFAFPIEDRNIPFSLHSKKKKNCFVLSYVLLLIKSVLLLISLRVLDMWLKFSSRVLLHCKNAVILRSEICRKESYYLLDKLKRYLPYNCYMDHRN